jgi:hypothetical protein
MWLSARGAIISGFAAVARAEYRRVAPGKSGKNAGLLGHIQPRIVSMAPGNNGKIRELMVGDKGLEPLTSRV